MNKSGRDGKMALRYFLKKKSSMALDRCGVSLLK